ncbi:hypothetical protein [Streptomyces spiramyceticus]|uniref:hypothetical protein n=1 Tax=Streptomyces spiramyceticus TaxID=299717 RepID=UPI00237A961A|nr:hypothetical protein [Streptomyces spiramyceticus]
MTNTSADLRVDLSALDEVLSKLRGLLKDMEGARSTSTYETEIPLSAFGHADFKQAKTLHGAHQKMKARIEEIIKQLEDLIDDFGKKTSKVRDKYSNREADTKRGLGNGSGGKDSLAN